MQLFSFRIIHTTLRRLQLRVLLRRVLDELLGDEDEALLRAFGQEVSDLPPPVSEAALREARRTADESDMSSTGLGDSEDSSREVSVEDVDVNNNISREEDVIWDRRM